MKGARATRRIPLAGAAASVLIFLAAGELLVRATGLDDRLLLPLLYLQDVHPAVHEPVDGPRHYRLKPGSRAVFTTPDPHPVTVTINSLGFRGPERPAAKRPGVIRILCLGGSNVYGQAVNDQETFPAQLERELNASAPGRFEVWNAGVGGYVLSQDVAAAREASTVLDPDMYLFMHTNKGRRPFLANGDDPRPYFAADPGLYAENLPFMPGHGLGLDKLLMPRWRFYRAAVVAVNYCERLALGGQKRGDDDPLTKRLNDRDEPELNLAALRGFGRSQEGRASVVLLVHPTQDADPEHDSLGLPRVRLGDFLPAGASREYKDLHPPPYVYRWYAKTLARELAPHLEAARRRKLGYNTARSIKEK